MTNQEIIKDQVNQLKPEISKQADIDITKIQIADDVLIVYTGITAEEMKQKIDLYKKYNNIGPDQERIIVATFVDDDKYPEFKKYGLKLHEYLGITEEQFYKLDDISVAKLIEARRKPYKVQPTGPIANTALMLITYDLQGKTMRDTKNLKYNHGAIDKNKKRTVEVSKPYDKKFDPYTVQIGASAKLNRRDNFTKKLFNLILSESNAQNNPQSILLRPSMLVDLGIYANTDTALKAINKAIPRLQSIAVEYVAGRGKNKRFISRSIIFTNIENESEKTHKRGKDAIYIDVNPKISLKDIAGYYAMFPLWGYALPSRSYDLLHYIQRQAIQRRQKGNLMKSGAFNVGIEAIANVLGLPHPDDTKNPRRDIIDAIDNAITEIEDAQRKAKMHEIYITPIYEETEDGSPNIRAYYSKGYLKVEYRETLLEYYNKRPDKSE